MANEELKAHLAELNRLMERSQLDKEDQNFLGHLMSEIVKHASGEDRQESTEASSFLDKLEAQAIKLEEAHPRLASVLRQLGKTLSDMGI